MPNIIPHDKFLHGIRLCRRNAKRLLRLANDAYCKECYHASFLLSFASLEETGKAIVILNHFHEDHITFEQYKNEFKNHNKKIFEAMKMMHLNFPEVFWIAPREAIFDLLLSTEPKSEDAKKISNIRLDSIYVDYNFSRNIWKRPMKDMKQHSWDVITKANEAYRYFLNESNYRGIRLRK